MRPNLQAPTHCANAREGLDYNLYSYRPPIRRFALIILLRAKMNMTTSWYEDDIREVRSRVR
eukprot:5291728-Pyramimonas_sp.AAC.1